MSTTQSLETPLTVINGMASHLKDLTVSTLRLRNLKLASHLHPQKELFSQPSLPDDWELASKPEHTRLQEEHEQNNNLRKAQEVINLEDQEHKSILAQFQEAERTQERSHS